MFNKFALNGVAITRPSSNTDTNAASSQSKKPNQEPKRHRRDQVTRACNWCRAYRVKCDNDLPCHNCVSRGTQCSRDGETGEQKRVLNLASALREIETLKQQVGDLQAQLDATQTASQTPCASSSSDFTPQNTSNPNDTGGHGRSLPEEEDGQHLFSEALEICKADTQFQGPLSSYIFSKRLYSYLRQVTCNIQQHDSAGNSVPTMLEDRASRFWLSPYTGNPGITAPELNRDVQNRDTDANADSLRNPGELTPSQEESFINAFFSSLGRSYPMTDRVDFEEYYQSLWVPVQDTDLVRQSSPLVDIILALSIRFSGVMLPGDGRADAQPPASLPRHFDILAMAHYLYDQCQRQLRQKPHRASLVSLQCRFWCSVNLFNTFQPSEAYLELGMAVREAHTLGLHVEMAACLSNRTLFNQPRIRRLMWWTLFTFDARLSLYLGRPGGIQISHTTCAIPSSVFPENNSAGKASSTEQLAARIFQQVLFGQQAKLYLAAGILHDTFYTQSGSRRGELGLDLVKGRSDTVEFAAETLTDSLDSLTAWADTIPPSLKSRREGGGVPLSTDLSRHDLQHFDLVGPKWFRRQTLILELQYHEAIMMASRPLISFPPIGQQTELPIQGVSPHHFESRTFDHAEKASRHAAAITHTLYQTCVETDILHGWNEVLHYQWNAASTLAGFFLAYPSQNRLGFETMLLSVQVFDSTGKATGAAVAVAQLGATVHRLARSGHQGDGVLE
ncbi:unnamed protein product [Clonostachys byssicola]|uniref:Zn(2)-C6 fungal-type domain-containing protein n=1 Tax=Clonostachys byssicola TaxID=160290 RepID=A0A9N9UL05_9HYPO|nr:unnamed protein product [Clonostachys byssicola]